MLHPVPLSLTLQHIHRFQSILRWVKLILLFILCLIVLLFIASIISVTPHSLPKTGALLLTSVLLLVVLGIVIYAERITQLVRNVTQYDYDRLIGRLQVAAQIARDATAEPDFNALLNSATQLIHHHFGFYHVGIFLLDDAGEYAVLHAAAGGSASHEMVKQHHKLKVGEVGLIGHITQTGEPRIAPDVRHDVQHYQNPALSKTRSEMAVPLKVHNTIIGALDIQSLQENAFTPDDILILQTLADLLAVAIQKARLNQALQIEAKQLEQRIEQRTAELAVERAQMSAVLETMADGVVFCENQRTIYVNPAFTRMFGYTRETWQGIASILDVAGITSEEVHIRQTEINEKLIMIGQWQGELRVHRLDGTELDVSAAAWHIQRTPEHLGTLLVLRDISQEKALQEQKSRFVSYASHELRTPITNLKTRLYLLEKQPHRFTDHIQAIQHVVDRMQRLVDDLLDMTRFESGNIRLEREVGSLQELIADVVATQRPEAERKRHVLTTQYPPVPLQAFIDRDRMTQVLTNLVANAINYTPEEGSITISLKELPDARAEISIEDTGVGIPSDYLPKIFLPFVRAGNTPAKGTGLGLSIARQIVEQHHGEIAVESEAGKGSRFFVRLQLALQPSSDRLP